MPIHCLLSNYSSTKWGEGKKRLFQSLQLAAKRRASIRDVVSNECKVLGLTN